MALKIALLTPKRRFIANRFGLGYQIPLGMVLIGGPLVDAGHRVVLLDNDALGWGDVRLVEELQIDPPDVVMLGHTGSTAAHPIAMRTARAVRQALPGATIVYGGVYPTYAAHSILAQHSEVDVVVQGEGEAAVVELAGALEANPHDLSKVAGISWRDRGKIRMNAARPPIQLLDAYRPGWELVDWEQYNLFGFGRAAGMQFSRGCTLRCTYCGQWAFWRRWRYRSPANFANELETLAKEYGVKIVWLADENFAAMQTPARETLQTIADRKLGLSLNLNMTAADVVRDADFLALSKEAGVDNIVMGVEALEDATVEKVRKNNPYATSRQAVQLLREHNIASLVNIIYGLEDESWRTVWRTARQVFRLDADILNAVYITPHFWTHDGQNTRAEDVIQPDQAKWTYRNQVIRTPHLRPWQLFLAVKLTEGLFHLRPRALWRMLSARDRRYRKVMRAYLWTGLKVWLAEVYKFLAQTSFVENGNLDRIPSYPLKESGLPK